jgi:hypothetical protein
MIDIAEVGCAEARHAVLFEVRILVYIHLSFRCPIHPNSSFHNQEQHKSNSTTPAKRTNLNTIYSTHSHISMSGQYQSYNYSQQGYNNYNNQYPQQSSYPSGGFADNQYNQQPYYNSAPQNNYYEDTRNSYSDSQSNSNASYYNNGVSNTQGAEADRGLLGAAGGALAGGYGGHKAGHGIMGAIGGAILGSLTEDYAKKHKKHKSSKVSSWSGSKY